MIAEREGPSAEQRNWLLPYTHCYHPATERHTPSRWISPLGRSQASVRQRVFQGLYEPVKILQKWGFKHDHTGRRLCNRLCMTTLGAVCLVFEASTALKALIVAASTACQAPLVKRVIQDRVESREAEAVSQGSGSKITHGIGRTLQCASCIIPNGGLVSAGFARLTACCALPIARQANAVCCSPSTRRHRR